MPPISRFYIMSEITREREEKEKREVTEALRRQMRIEGELIGLYEETISEVESEPVKQMLHMIRLDSQKHIDICRAAIDIIEGKDVLMEERRDLRESLKRHLELEKESIDAANGILKHGWVSDNQGLNELIRGWRDDERRHHKALKELSEKRFFRVESTDWVSLFREEDFLEERYLRSKKYQQK